MTGKALAALALRVSDPIGVAAVRFQRFYFPDTAEELREFQR
jgi:hypothetical protein